MPMQSVDGRGEPEPFSPPPGTPLASQATSYGGFLTIDLAAIRRNYRLLADRSMPAETATVVKADAYGLGVGEVAPALYAAGCRTFFVAHVTEGVQLRAILPADVVIFVLHGPPPGAEPECAAHDLTPVLNGSEQSTAWLRFVAHSGLPGRCAIQFDTGLTRFGFDPHEADAVVRALAAMNLRPALVMSHLACADEADDPANAAQAQLLGTLREYLPDTPFSLAASSGLFLGSAYHLDLVRPGAALYGVNPVAVGSNPMAPVVRLQGRIMQMRAVQAGTAIGYGLTAVTAAATYLATVSVGYADGLLRSASNRAAAWLDGVRLPMLGRVSMDSIVVDLGGLTGDLPEQGDLVDILSSQYDINDLAADAETIAYGILIGLGSRLHRTYVD